MAAATKLIFTLLAVLVALQSCSGATGNLRDDIVGERDLIYQFINYVDINSRIRLDNMLEITRVFVSQVLDTLQSEERGDSAQMLQQYVDYAGVVIHSDSLLHKQEVLLRLQHLVATINEKMARPEPEDIKIRTGLLGMFEQLARLSIEEHKFYEKFSKGAKALRLSLSPQGIQRNAVLLDMMTEFEEAEGDIVRREQLIKRFAEIRLHEYGSAYV